MRGRLTHDEHEREVELVRDGAAAARTSRTCASIVEAWAGCAS